MKKGFIQSTLCCIVLFTAIIPFGLYAQSSIAKDTIYVAAREIMKETTYCGFVTIDATGQPQMRTMNPFPANDEFITWFATSRSSRKVLEIKANPKVCVYFADHTSAKGYVSITGTAEVIDDKALLVKMKRGYWESIPDWQNNFVLIKVMPVTMDVINYKHGLVNDPKTFRAPSVIF
jgi:general stress protein 26